ncbi:MMPL family transporter [Apibacter raozihei]|uniref:MMPL family transporter n=1 Tax=Apibacter raozihei TaxID=2500547 RepID=UPI000FE4277D|nr:MMPL family transporter [Apibacter raozihei]
MFNLLYDFFSKRKGLFYSLTALLTGLLILFASKIKFEEDITRLLPADGKSEEIKNVLETARFSDKLIINIEGDHPDDLKSYAKDFDSLARISCADYIQKLQTRINEDKIGELMDFVQENLPLFLDEQDYKYLDSLIATQPIQNKINESYHSLLSPGGFVTTQMIRKDPLGMLFLGIKKLQQVQVVDNFELDDGFVISKQKKNLLLFITTKLPASETDKNTEFIHLLDEIVNKLNKKYTDKSKAEYYGAVAVSVANAQQIKKDIQLTMGIALILLLTLYVYFYRKLYIPIVIFVPAIFGSLLGISVLYLLKGTISAVSIGIGSVLLGITLDYSVHILSHYRSSGDIKKLFKDIVSPLLMCAIFTAVDFLCLLLLHSDVLKDLGIFAAVSVLGAALFALLFIPQVYKPQERIKTLQNTFIDRLSAYDFSQNKYVLGACFLVITVCLFTFNKVGFNNDLNSLNYVPANLQLAEDNLNKLNDYSSKSIYVVSYGNTYDNSLQTNHELYEQLKQKKDLKEILSFSSIGGLLLSEEQQKERIQNWKKFWSPDKIKLVQQLLIFEGKKVGFKETTFQPFYDVLDTYYEPMSKESHQLYKDLFLDDFIASKSGITGITTVIKIKDNNSQKLIQEISSTNKNVLVIDRKNLQENILGNLEQDFNDLFWISTLVVFVAVFIYFRSIEITLLTNIPIFIGWMVTLGIMGIFGIQFNAFNIIITTLIFGLGIDYSIFISQALLEEYTTGENQMKTYKSGVIMSALTTILCFGVLIFAKHPAIKSIAIIPLIGLLVVVFISFTVQPWLFSVLLLKPQQKGYTPFRLLNFVTGILGFGFFLLMSLLLNSAAFIFSPLLPERKTKKNTFLFKIFKTIFRTLIFMFPGVNVKSVGFSKKLYDTPTIIIANHSSELDTIIMGMFDYRQIFMINERIYNSRFFGKIIRVAGYFPTSKDLDTDLNDLKEKIHQGYSLIIFPEGTRSDNSKIRRFHKGAFYLAEKLKMDIQPVMIHGNSDRLPKKETWVNSGTITVRYLDKISYKDCSFGNSYSERTKNIMKWFRGEFKKFKIPLESPDYFRNKLFLNYLYKGPSIKKAIKTEYEWYKNFYTKIYENLPDEVKAFHYTDSWCVLDLLLLYSSPTWKISVVEDDELKRKIIENSYSQKKYPINFINEIPDNWESYNTLIFTDKGIPLDKGIPNSVEWLIGIRTEINHSWENFEIVLQEKDIFIMRRKQDGKKL